MCDPIYDYDAEMAITLITKIHESFSQAAEVIRNHQLNKALLENSLGISLTPEEFSFLNANKFSNDLLQKLSRILSSFYENTFITQRSFEKTEREKGITIVNGITRVEENLKDVSSVLNIKEIDPLLSRKVNAVFKSDQTDARRFSFSFLKKLIEPNLTFNKEATDKKILSAAEEVKPFISRCKKMK